MEDGSLVHVSTPRMERRAIDPCFEHFRSSRRHFEMGKGGVFLRKTLLGCVSPVYTNSENAIPPKLEHQSGGSGEINFAIFMTEKNHEFLYSAKGGGERR